MGLASFLSFHYTITFADRVIILALSMALYLLFLPMFFFQVVGPVEDATVKRQMKHVTQDFMADMRSPLTGCGSNFATHVQSMQPPDMQEQDAEVVADRAVAKRRIWALWGTAAMIMMTLAIAVYLGRAKAWPVGHTHTLRLVRSIGAGVLTILTGVGVALVPSILNNDADAQAVCLVVCGAGALFSMVALVHHAKMGVSRVNTLGSLLVSAGMVVTMIVAAEFAFVYLLPNNVNPLNSNEVKKAMLESMDTRLNQCPAYPVIDE